MTDGKELLGTTRPAQGMATSTPATTQETMAANGAPMSNAQPESPAIRPRWVRTGRIVVVLVAGAVASWLYIGEVAKNLGPVPPATRSGATLSMKS